MEISVVKSKGYIFNVIFTGNKYYFINSWCGVAAIATRKGYETENEQNTFILSVGNDHLTGGSFGGSEMVTLCKRVINKAENQFIKKTVKYEVINEPLHHLRIELHEIVLSGNNWVDRTK
jgi:hypothetical protein